MAKFFPYYPTAEAARCFKGCAGALTGVKRSGHARDCGAYVGRCPSCGMATWFDLPWSDLPPYRAGEADD